MNPSVSPAKARKRPQSSFLARFWWLGIVALAAGVGVISFELRPTATAPMPLKGYVTDLDTLREEYRRYYGKPLASSDSIEQQFEEANLLMLKRDLGAAVGMLEGLLPAVAVPLVYNNLGVLYAALQDRGRTVKAFREALARDASYRPVRENLVRLETFIAESADPLSQEKEDNDGHRDANHIAVGKAVEGSIAPDEGDVDSFRFSTPPPPRDILSIEVMSKEKSLKPAMKIFDNALRLIDTAEGAGEVLVYKLVPSPNTVLHLQVWGIQDTSGPYTLTVHPLKAYDRFEPNDDIDSASFLTAGTAEDAGIMDTEDTDFYSFVASHTGPVNVEVRNRSNSLIPALTTFDSSRGNTGAGPDVKSPGANLRHAMTVENGRTYYLQIRSQGGTSGNYSLTVK